VISPITLATTVVHADSVVSGRAVTSRGDTLSEAGGPCAMKATMRARVATAWTNAEDTPPVGDDASGRTCELYRRVPRIGSKHDCHGEKDEGTVENTAQVSGLHWSSNSR
jgi:hypothetical protein